MALARNGKITVGAVAGVALLAAAFAAVTIPGANPAAAVPTLAFEATFDTASDFYGRFDYGYSGGTNFPRTPIHGDHAVNPAPACGGPTTQRNVALTGPDSGLDFSQLFWWCAPSGDPSSGHLMTAQDTPGYNVAWFSPQPLFHDVVKVCWDINETWISHRKWTQVNFVSAADAVRFPAGMPIQGSGFSSFARGVGGFDLGFTNPDHRTGSGPSTGVDPVHPIAGFASINGSANWFNDATWTSLFNGPTYHQPETREQTTDKAARFAHCIEQTGPNQITLTKATPDSGTVVRVMTGHIPPGDVRVVFADDEYDGAKDAEAYNPDNLTWHWDNVRVYTAAGGPPPTTTLPPTTTTTVPPTTTTLPPTTTTTTTTLPPTTTTTTTIPPTTTTTVPDPCPSTFNAEEHAWCQSVEARL
jgi:hypothetical protein